MSRTHPLAAAVAAVLLWAPLAAQTQVIQPAKAEKATETLKVPRRVVPSLETVNGEVALSGTRGAASLTTVNGGVRAVDLGESLQATTVNGAISLE